MKKGQTEIVSAVLLMGIMIGLVTVAYFWGVPLIQKQQDVVRVDNMNDFMRGLHENIKSVAKGGGREVMKSVDIPGDLRIDEGTNSVILNFEASGTVIAPGEQIIIVGDNNNTVSPISSDPGYISVKSDRIGDSDEYDIEMNLIYRELTTATDSFKIELRSVGRPNIGGAGHVITIEAGQTEDRPGAGDAGKDLHITTVLLRME